MSPGGHEILRVTGGTRTRRPKGEWSSSGRWVGVRVGSEVTFDFPPIGLRSN